MSPGFVRDNTTEGMLDILSLSAVKQSRLLRERAISSRDLVGAHLERIRAVNPQINAAIEVFEERAMEDAAAADRRIAAQDARPLEGVPFSVKDSIEIAGVQCTAGTIGRAHSAPATCDATLVARLRAAGAIPIARTNLPDLLFAFESDNLLYGRTNSPYDTAYTPGGSSGGEAALIAACGSPFGLGSDAAGSVRVPAAFSGIASIKPTSGRLPRTGHVPPAGGWIESLWQIGPMARWVEDLQLVMPLLVGPDGHDHTAPGVPWREEDASGLRAAFWTDGSDAEVSAVIRAAAQVLDADDARPACIDDAYDLEMKLLGPDGGDGLRAYLKEIGSVSVHPLLEGWLQKLEPYRTDVAGLQRYWGEWDAYRAEMTAFARTYDVIVCPAYAHAGLRHGESVKEANFRGFAHTITFNVAGWPAAVVRCGTSSEGLPVAVQIAAAPWRESAVLAVAKRLEESMGGWQMPEMLG